MKLFDIGVGNIWDSGVSSCSVRYCNILLTFSVLLLILKIPLDFLGIIIMDLLLFVDSGSFSSSWHIKVWYWIHWWDINARSRSYWGLCPFLNYGEKMEFVCHPPLLSSEFLLLAPCLLDVNCMFHPRSSSGGDSKSWNY